MASALGDFAKGFSSTVMPAFTAAQRGRERALEINRLEEEEEFRTKRSEIAPIKTITTADGSTFQDPVDTRRWNSEQLALVGQFKGADAYADAQTKMLANSQAQFANAARNALLAYQSNDSQAYANHLNTMYRYIGSTPSRITVDEDMGAVLTTYDGEGNEVSSRPIMPAELEATTMLATSPELFVRYTKNNQDVADRRTAMEFNQNLAIMNYEKDVRQFGQTIALQRARHNLDVMEFHNNKALNDARQRNDTRRVDLLERQHDEMMDYRRDTLEQGADQFERQMDNAAERLDIDRDRLDETVRRNDMLHEQHGDTLAARADEFDQTMLRRDEEIEIKKQAALANVATARGVARKQFNDAAARTDDVLNAEFDRYADPVAFRLYVESLPPAQRQEAEATAQTMGSLRNRNLIRQIAGGFLANNYDAGVTPEEAAQYAIQLVMGDPVESAQVPSSGGGYGWALKGNQGQAVIVPYVAHSILDREEEKRRARQAQWESQKFGAGVRAQGQGFNQAIEATPPTPSEAPATPTTRGSTVSPAPRRAYSETQSPRGAGRGIPAGQPTAIPVR